MSDYPSGLTNFYLINSQNRGYLSYDHNGSLIIQALENVLANHPHDEIDKLLNVHVSSVHVLIRQIIRIKYL